jgi:hypothetical protein
MRGVKGVLAAAVAAATSCCCVDFALADPAARNSERMLYFSGADLWQHGYFAHGGLVWSPGGLDAEGLVFKALVNGGLYRYESGALGGAEVTGRVVAGFLAPGWRFKRDRLTLTVFAGLDLQSHRLTPADPGAQLNGGYVGARFAAELWYQPTDLSMISVDGAISTIGGNYAVRGAAGLRIFNLFYLGPEVQAVQSNDYRQFRVGAHVTALRTGDFEWTAAAGWALDTDDRSGAYGRIGVLVRR